MTNAELARKLYWMAGHGLAVNWQDNRALKEAADRLMALGNWALVCEEAPRVLTYEEIVAAPEGAVMWEEFYDTGDVLPREPAAPVVKIGAELHGSGTSTDIEPHMHDLSRNVDNHGWFGWRWWTSRPSARLCEETPWGGEETHGKPDRGC